MKYYVREHADGYARVRAVGKSAWDQLHGRATFEDAEIREVLAEVLPRLRFASPHPAAREHGCGTGPGACLLAERGMRARGVDLSPVAIEIARREAASRGLEIDYRVGDVCEIDATTGDGDRIDLVVDSFCLQCIVTDADRSKLFAFVRAALQPGGSFIVETAGYSPLRDYGDCAYDRDTGIVLEPQSDRTWLPCRRHVTADAPARELAAAGFTVERSRTAADGDIAAIARPAAT